MIMIFTSLILIVSALFNVYSSKLTYYDPHDPDRTDYNYAIRGLGSIPRELGEKVLTTDADHEIHAANLIVAANRDFSVMREGLRKLVAENFGIAAEHDSTDGAISESESVEAELPTWPPLGENLSILKDSGMQFDPPREFQLLSRPYNHVKEVGGHSEVRIRLTDATKIFGKTMTIVQIRRGDLSREWDRLFYLGGIPLPYKKSRRFILITDTEIHLIERLEQRIPGLVLKYFVPPYPLTREQDRQILQSELIEAAKEF